MTQAFIGLGGNLGPTRDNLSQALKYLDGTGSCKVLGCSSWYQSKALVLDGQSQADYLNAVCELETSLDPMDLLDVLQSIENTLGRVRTQRWGARTVDLDLLLFGRLQLHTERLRIPHPELSKRNFVLQPLAEIAPKLKLPNNTSVSTLATKSGWDGLTKLQEATA